MSESGTKTQVPNWFNQFSDTLECPVCFKTIVDPPVFNCPNGHILCHSCHLKIQKRNDLCPVCNDKLGNKRNIVVESMLDKLPKQKCKFDGCFFKRVETETIQKHEAGCKFREIKCLLCDTKLPLCSYILHLIQVEDVNPKDFLKVAFGHFSYRKLARKPTLLIRPQYHVDRLSGKQILFYLNIAPYKGHHITWIATDRPRFKYTIELLDKDNSTVVSSYTSKCVDPDVTTDQMREDLNCFVFSKKTISKIKTSNKFNFRYKIDRI